MYAGAAQGTVTAWSDTRVCASFPGARLSDGLLEVVRADGQLANRLPFLASGEVLEVELPSPLFPDSLVRVRGRNLGHQSESSQAVMHDDDLLVLWPPGAAYSGQGYLSVSKGDKVLLERSFTVTPRVHHGCRTARPEWCHVYGVGFGMGTTSPEALTEAGGYSATVAGLAVRLKSWSQYSITFVWPEGLAPGLHPFTASSPLGVTVQAQVELLAPSRAPTVLVRGAPFPAAYGYGQTRPVVTREGLWAPMVAWQNGESPSEEATPGLPGHVTALPEVLETGRQRPGEALFTRQAGGPFYPGYPVNVLETPAGVVLVGTRNTTPSNPSPDTPSAFLQVPRFKADGSFQFYEPRMVGQGSRFTEPVMVSGAGQVGGASVAVVSLGHRRRSVAMRLQPQPDGDLVWGPQVEVGPVYGWEGGLGEPRSHGAWVVDAGVYLSSCRDPQSAQGAQVRFTPLVPGTEGGLGVGTEQTVLSAPGSRILACNTAGEGFVWVERAASGAEAIYAHQPGGARRLVTEVGPDVPGIGVNYTYSSNVQLPGITDLAVLEDGDILLLLNLHAPPQPGLALARWDASGGGWTVTPGVVPASTSFQFGELCVGPVLDNSTCEGWARYGCSSVACAVRPPEVRARPTTHVGEAYLVPRGDGTVSIVYEVVETERYKSVSYGGTEVHHVRVPVP